MVMKNGSIRHIWKIPSQVSDTDIARHVLNRLTFGSRPQDIERVLNMGIEDWFEQQLAGNMPDEQVNARLAKVSALTMSSQDIVDTYPEYYRVVNEAKLEGVIPKENVDTNNAETKKTLREYMDRKGYRYQEELWNALYRRKLVGAIYGNNQLSEVLCDFWTNHFNVAFQNPQARVHLFSYERDAVRPRVLSSFGNLLSATAHHPAMLHYLDNVQNRVMVKDGISKPSNENYAREIMELHTLGVNGGYTQDDVINVARILTGWTAVPAGAQGAKVLNGIEPRKPADIVLDDRFWFRAALHDTRPKEVMQVKYTGMEPLQEGETLLANLAGNAATANHIARKLCSKFVSDSPSPALIEKTAKTYKDSYGSIAAMMKTIVASSDFWAEAKKPAKVKSPLELVVSSLRAIDADVTDTGALVSWLSRMGQPLYGYYLPPGYPDRADYWMNSGTLLLRINFGLALAQRSINGVKTIVKGKPSDEAVMLASAPFQYR